MSKDIVTTNIQFNSSRIQRLLSTLVKDSQVGYAIHNEFYKMSYPWVPYLHGPLSETVDITSRYVRYYQPYAHYQYHGQGFNHTKEVHPLATAYWDKAMMQAKGDEFKRVVQGILKRRAKELNI